jgi:hypothetical protein
MEASQLEFEIERWTDKEIVTKRAGDACIARALTLDLVDKRARSRVTYPRESSRCAEGHERTLELVAGYRMRAEAQAR